MHTLNDTLTRLQQIISERRHSDPDASYVARMFKRGRKKMAQKVGEEAVEVVIAAMIDDKCELVMESADLLFHLMVLWEETGVTAQDIAEEFVRREGVSGLDEKKKRIL